VSARIARRALIAAAVAALAAPVAADANVRLRAVDATGFPTVRITVVSPTAASAPPTLTENGRRVVGFHAVNLASSKSIVVAVDRSRSMAGAKLRDALAAAREFLRTKGVSDRVSVVAFGASAVQLTPFSSSTADADDALRILSVDKNSGTALDDALQLSASALRNQAGRSRVVVLLTDGKDVSSHVSLTAALATAHSTGTIVYPIAIEE
jgi:Ca-activated chloride channel family protein